MKSKLLRLVAMIFALSLFATACGADDVVSDAVDSAADTASDAAEQVEDAVTGDDEAMEEEAMDEEEVGGAVEQEAAEEALADTEDVEDGGVVTTSIADLEAEWAAARDSIVADIKANGYGVDGTTLNGPGGWTVDLSACPSDWSDGGGISDGTITIGHTTAQSGSLAAYGNIGVGMNAYFEYINDTGGIGPDGLQLNLIIKDDAYVATQTQELVAELLQTEDPFYITTLGSPNTFAVQKTLNESCVPQPLSMTGHQAWGDPENNPWTTGLQMSYATESLLWGAWIEQNMEPGTKVAALVMDNDFGLAYEQGFDQFAEASDIISEVTFVRHDPAAATLTNEITTLAASEPDVFISMTAGNPCLLATQEAARAGITDIAKAYFQPSVCKAVSAYMAPAGDAADNWLIFGGGAKDSTDPQYENDTYISWMNDQIEDAGLDSSVSLYATGYGLYGWAHVEALRIAAELDGGLTRTNFMIAVRSLRTSHPALLDGIAFGQLDGQSPNCAWVAGEGC